MSGGVTDPDRGFTAEPGGCSARAGTPGSGPLPAASASAWCQAARVSAVTKSGRDAVADAVRAARLGEARKDDAADAGASFTGETEGDVSRVASALLAAGGESNCATAFTSALAAPSGAPGAAAAAGARGGERAASTSTGVASDDRSTTGALAVELSRRRWGTRDTQFARIAPRR